MAKKTQHNPGLIIAAPASGSGKTSVTLGLLRAFRRGGVSVRPLKVGPDYIDPQFHAHAAGQPSHNIDGWAMRPALMRELMAGAVEGDAFTLCEGVMGLFDKAQASSKAQEGSTAEIARQTGWPVLLVVNCAGMAQSVGALVAGFAGFDSRVTVAGVLLNRVASERHREMLCQGLSGLGIQVLGALPRHRDIELPSRHLGLVQAEELADIDRRIDGLADLVRAHCDLEAIRALARDGDPCGRPSAAEPFSAGRAGRAGGTGEAACELPPLGQRIAVARDVAFRFTYPHLVSGWRAAGAEITTFSPLADEAPDASADAIFLPGGYPELHAGKLAASKNFHEAMRKAAARGTVIYGECGGYMMLGKSLEDAEGRGHEMLGLLDLETSFAVRSLHLGYRHVATLCETPFGPTGTRLRAHEFHYSRVVREEGRALLRSMERAQDYGLRAGSVYGSFLHFIDIDG